MVTQVERQVLYKKYISAGYDSSEANERIKRFCDFLRNLGIKLRKEKHSEENINIKFHKEFEKLCQKVEAERIERLKDKSSLSPIKISFAFCC